VYWGDIDAAGLGILARLRNQLPNIHSTLMDVETKRSQSWALVEDPSVRGQSIPQDLLTDAEWAAWREATKRGQRLEQERIPLSYAHAAISKALGLPNQAS
jgi:hypothetical protein